MPTFNTFVKQVEINSAGSIRITALKQTIQDDGAVIDHPHQITIDTLVSDDEIAAQIADVNEHLNRMGYPSLRDEEIDWPLRLRNSAHKLPIIKERRDKEQKDRDNERKKQEAARAEQQAQADAQAAELKRQINEAVAAAVKEKKQ